MAAPQPMFLGRDFQTEHKNPPELILDEDFEIIELKVERNTPYKKAKGLNLRKIQKVVRIGLGTIGICSALLFIKNMDKDFLEPKSEIEVDLSKTDSSIINNTVIETMKKSFPQIEETAVSSPVIEIESNTINEPIVSKTYDFSFEGRSNDIPTREYSVKDTYETSLPGDLINLLTKYSTMYGIDPCLFRALCTQESHFNHDVNPKNSAIGVCQIEQTNFGDVAKAYDYETNTYDYLDINYENAANLEKNIQLGAMLFQKKLDKYGDLYIAIQSYNYGESMMDHLINLSGLEKPTYEQLLPRINDVHNNPSKYINNWEYSTYGDNLYPQNVLRYLPGNITYYNIDENIVLQNVDKNEKIGTYSVISNENNEWILEDNTTNERIKLENVSIPLNKGYAK